MEPNKHSIGSIIAGILFLIVFIGGMIGIYIGTTDDIRISIIRWEPYCWQWALQQYQAL